MKRGWFCSLALAVAMVAISGCSKSGQGSATTGSTAAGGASGSANPAGGAPMVTEHEVEGQGHGAESGGPMGSDVPAGPAGSSACAAAGVAWQLPKRWTIGPERPMRVATYAIPAAGGAQEGAECAVFHFGPNQGGDIDSNIRRWIGQFQPATSSKRSSKEVNGLKVDLVQIAGTYTAPAGPMMQSSGDKPDSRLLGAIVSAPQGLVFFKLTGPAKSVGAASKEFDGLVASFKRQ
jgi:hypothetical protein